MWVRIPPPAPISSSLKELNIPKKTGDVPLWLYFTTDLINTHRANLYRKDPLYYSDFKSEPMEYLWPTKHKIYHFKDHRHGVTYLGFKYIFSLEDEVVFKAMWGNSYTYNIDTRNFEGY